MPGGSSDGASSRTPRRTPSRRREPGPLNERAANDLRAAKEQVQARLNARELAPQDPNDLAPEIRASNDCQFAAVLLALQHPLRPGSLNPINPGRKPPINAQEVKKIRRKARKWMIEHYHDLHKKSVIDGSWFTYYGVSASDCITKAAWTECANKYAPTGGDGEWKDRSQGDRMSLFALAHIYKCNIRLYTAYDADPERITPIFGRLVIESEIHIANYRTPDFGHFIFARPKQDVEAEAQRAATALGAARDPAPATAPQVEANAPRAGANTEQAEPEMGAQGDAAALNAAGGAGGAAASPALPELAAAIEMHPGARQLYQERMDTMEALLAQGRIQQDYMDSMRNRMRTYFEAQNDIDVHILRAIRPI